MPREATASRGTYREAGSALHAIKARPPRGSTSPIGAREAPYPTRWGSGPGRPRRLAGPVYRARASWGTYKIYTCPARLSPHGSRITATKPRFDTCPARRSPRGHVCIAASRRYVPCEALDPRASREQWQVMSSVKMVKNYNAKAIFLTKKSPLDPYGREKRSSETKSQDFLVKSRIFSSNRRAMKSFGDFITCHGFAEWNQEYVPLEVPGRRRRPNRLVETLFYFSTPQNRERRKNSFYAATSLRHRKMCEKDQFLPKKGPPRGDLA